MNGSSYHRVHAPPRVTQPVELEVRGCRASAGCPGPPTPDIIGAFLAASNQFSEQMSATNGNRFAWLQDSQAGDVDMDMAVHHCWCTCTEPDGKPEGHA